MEIEILAAHQRTRETYSAKRLHSDLEDHGVQTTPYRVRTLRKKLGLRCKQKRKFKVTTDSKNRLPVAPNVLKREFVVSAPDKAWISDITYIPTDEGWLYLAGVKDLFNGELVGYDMNERMTKDLVMQALFRATSKKHPTKGLILHSDSQYTSHEYREHLSIMKMEQSMSRKGNYRDNSPTEWFFRSLKHEQLNYEKFRTKEEAKLSIIDYLAFYNGKRTHSKLGYQSPLEFERVFYRKTA